MPVIPIQGDASASTRYIPPVSGMLYGNYFTGAGVTGRNLVPGGPVPTVVGAPTNTAGYLEAWGNVNFIDTGILDTIPDITMMAVCKANAVALQLANATMFIGAYSGGGATQVALNMFASTAANSPFAASLYAGTAKTLPVDDTFTASTAWAVRSLRMTEKTLIIDDLTAKKRLVVDAGSVRTVSGLGLRIGSARASFGGRAHMHSAFIFGRPLTDAEVATMYAGMKVAAAKQGLTV